MRRWLSRIAPIYPGEGAVVALCLAVNFLIVAGIVLGRNARDSLFLVYFGIGYLPYMYFANAVFLVLCSLAYTALVDRIERGKFLAGLSLLFVIALLVSRLILLRLPHWFFPVLYIEAQFIWYFSLMQFWTFIGDLFDTRQAKRLFPLLAVGALLGMVAVGVSSRVIVHSLGTENLLLVWAGLIFTATVLAGIGFRRYRSVPATPRPEDAVNRAPLELSEWQKIKESLDEVGREPLLRSMAGYILLLWTVYAVVDFCFNKTMRMRYPEPNDLTTFFGRFIGVQGLVCLAVQLFFTRAVISRLGVGTTINFHPALLVFGTAWLSFQYGYASVLITKLGDATMLYTFSDSSYQLLYNPFPPDRRARVRGFLEGYIRPLSLAAAGGFILIGNTYLKPLYLWGREIVTAQQLSWGAFALAAMWLSFALMAKQGYIRALLRNLHGASPALRQAAAAALTKLKDPASLAILSETLRSENPDRVVAALQFLESFQSDDATRAIAALLDHPDPYVRATAVSALGRQAGTNVVERLAPLLEDPNPRVRANAIEALAAAKDPALVERLRPLLQDPSMRARVNTVITLTAIQGVSAALERMPLIRDLARGDRTARSRATYVLGRLPLEQSMDLLAELLNDPEIQIRCEAARALGRIGSPRAIPPLIEALAGPPDLRHFARRSLAVILQRSGEESVGSLMKTAVATDRPEIRSELADVLGRLRGFPVLETLISLLEDPEWRVRWKVLKSIERLVRTAPMPEKVRPSLFKYARNELSALRQSLRCSQTLVPHPHDESERVLEQALEEDRVKIEERVFRTLGILCGRDQMLSIFQKLNSGDPRLKADALEAFDNLAPKDIAREVLALLEPAPGTKGTSVPPEPLLAALARHPKPWIRACTAYYLGHHPRGGGETLLKDLLQDHDHVVRETALLSGWLAFKEAWRPLVDAASQSPDAALRRSAQKILGRGTQ